MENLAPSPHRPVLLTKLRLCNSPPDLNLFRCQMWADRSIKYSYCNVSVKLWSVKLSMICNTRKRFCQRLDTSITFNKTNVIGLTKSSFNGCSRFGKRYEETCAILECRYLYSCFHTFLQGSDDDMSRTGSCVFWTFTIVLVSKLITLRLGDMIGSRSQVKEWKERLPIWPCLAFYFTQY
jgi:hypothetical protein